jgi:hypothetical protein
MPLDKSWYDHNESPNERGHIPIDIEFIKSWKKGIKNMDEEGELDIHLNTLTVTLFLAFAKIGFKSAYRTVQGIIRGLSD